MKLHEVNNQHDHVQYFIQIKLKGIQKYTTYRESCPKKDPHNTVKNWEADANVTDTVHKQMQTQLLQSSSWDL